MYRRFIFLFLISLFCRPAAAQNIEFRSNLNYSYQLNDIWGYADIGGSEYALVGLRQGTSIVDVTDPDNPAPLFFIPGPLSVWRDIKTWQNYAYVVHDNVTTGEPDGLLIIDLQYLPDSIRTIYWKKDTAANADFQRAHNIFIDEKGFAYLFGSNVGGGALILDLSDPEDPAVAGNYEERYVHDGYARNATLWTAEILSGTFSVVDVSDKPVPLVLASHETTNRLTHNIWLSDNGKTAFTTDESKGAYITAYDVSDLSNITELSRYRSNPGTGLIPHNVTVLNDFLAISYYKEGVFIVDAHRPQNLVEVGHYDTSPFPPSDGFNGAWGVYPYLPSGNILVSDIEEGLFVLTPEYKRAAYLEGTVTDSLSGAPLRNVEVRIEGANAAATTDIAGAYKTGAAEPGIYDVTFILEDSICRRTTVKNVELESGEVTLLNVKVSCFEPADAPFYFYVHPAAFTDATVFYFSVKEQPVIIISDISGRIIDEFRPESPVGKISYPADKIAAGIYFATLKTNNIFETIKFVKTNQQ